jgi:hypothetical protein
VLSPARFRQVRDQIDVMPVADAQWRRAYPRLLNLFEEVRVAGAEITTDDGEVVVPCVAVFRHRARSGALDALRSADVVRSVGDGWVALGRPTDRQPLGLATVRGRRLHVTCATIERAGRVRALVEEVCGPDEVRWLSTIYSNLDFLAIEMLESLRLPEPHVHDPAIFEALREVVPEFLADWWDVPNVRLDGATPREGLDRGGRAGALVRTFVRALEGLLGTELAPVAAG